MLVGRTCLILVELITPWWDCRLSLLVKAQRDGSTQAVAEVRLTQRPGRLERLSLFERPRKGLLCCCKGWLVRVGELTDCSEVIRQLTMTWMQLLLVRRPTLGHWPALLCLCHQRAKACMRSKADLIQRSA